MEGAVRIAGPPDVLGDGEVVAGPVAVAQQVLAQLTRGPDLVCHIVD